MRKRARSSACWASLLQFKFACCSNGQANQAPSGVELQHASERAAVRPSLDPDRVCMSARRVQRAFPVRELATDTDTINVEMDPEDELRVRSSIAADHGMQCAP